MLVDKSLFPRDKVCGDGIPEKCFPLIAELGIKEESIIKKGYSIRKMNIHTTGGETITYSNPDENSSSKSLCMPRIDFDFILLQQAKNILDKMALGMKLIQIKRVSKNTHCLTLEEVETGKQKETSNFFFKICGLTHKSPHLLHLVLLGFHGLWPVQLRSISSSVLPLVSGITFQTKKNCGIKKHANKKKLVSTPSLSRIIGKT